MTSRAAASAARPFGTRPGRRATSVQVTRSRPPARAPPARTRPGRAAAAHRRRACASCRSGSRPPVPRSRRAGPARRGRGADPGEPWGSAACGPASTATSNASASAPPSRMSVSRRQASAASVTPARISGRRAASARSPTAQAAAIRSTSAGSLTARSRVDPRRRPAPAPRRGRPRRAPPTGRG